MPTIDKKNIEIEPGWLAKLSEEFNKDYMKSLRTFLQGEYKKGKVIYPKGSQYFAALNTTPFQKVKVVIIGQDPYHGANQAHGLCFSVQDGVDAPPSLVNIFKELETDVQLPRPKNGDLTNWAKQGVLLLNAVLTVENGKAASHQGKGWEQFTDEIIRHLNSERENLVFILWGSYAQKKSSLR